MRQQVTLRPHLQPHTYKEFKKKCVDLDVEPSQRVAQLIEVDASTAVTTATDELTEASTFSVEEAIA